MRILVADDDASTRLVLVAQLDQLGHTVLEVQDGNDAIAALERDRYDVAILDWDMPGADGLDITFRVRSREEQARSGDYTYVIMITGAYGMDAYMTAMDAGVDDFMIKPVATEILAARIAVAERIHRMRRQVAQYEQLLPVCTHCKRIREERGWVPMERYLARHTHSALSHGICPDCQREHFGDLLE